MSLLKHADRCIESLAKYAARQATISHPTNFSAVRDAATAADARETSGQPLSPIDGRLIAIKDNICTQDLPTTSASRILKSYASPLKATVIEKLESAGAIPFNKTNMDEFGMGSHSTHSAYHHVAGFRDQHGEELSAGGSSGGSGVAVAMGQAWAALGTDTGGSVRLPAACNGIIGFKPSYGDISRFGVIPYANSLDTVGILASSVADAQNVYKILSGYDEKDPTSLSNSTRRRIAQRLEKREHRNKLRIGLPVEFNIEELGPDVRKTWKEVVNMLQDLGHEVYSVQLPRTKQALSAYYLLAAAEASSNLGKYDGARFGNPSDMDRPADSVLYSQTRGENIGAEAKRRILLGSFSLNSAANDNYFKQTTKIRRLLSEDFDRAFALPNPLKDKTSSVGEDSGVDVIISPTAPTRAPNLQTLLAASAVKIYSFDVLTVPASMAGLPSVNVPIAIGDRPEDTVGMQATAQFGDVDMVFRIAKDLESLKLT